MLVLDTDVASALMRGKANSAVVRWAAKFDDESIYLTSTTISELIFGVMTAPEGRRKNELDDALSDLVFAFGDRILDFDFDAAFELGRFTADRRAAGRPMGRADAQIAACCVSNSATLATRNVKDFENIPGLTVVNPWDEA